MKYLSKPFAFITLNIGVGLLLSSCLLLQPSATKLTNRAYSETKQYDAIIVPGVPFNEPYWDMTMQMRVLWATHLYKKGSARKIIMSGSSVYSPYVEAEIMKLYASALGVPNHDIIIEDKAEHSTENLWYGYKLAKSLGLHKIALATDPFQTRLTYRFAKRKLKDMHYLPVLFDTLRTIPHDTPTINYHALKIDNFVPITEKQSFWYRLKGTRGLNINYKE
jgi:uncharacterized SAM-binding protein YcdF (DUF218 family)